MSWGARIRAAIQGEVDGADVRALLVAGTPSASLRQGLADRRLAVELAHLQEAWRVPLDLAPVAAPLWLADALCMLAGSLVDAETAAHPQAPETMSALAHQRALALLQPVATLIADASAALADPGRPLMLQGPLSVGPAMDQHAAYPLPAYLRGLLQGANRLDGAAQVALEDLATLSGRAPGPEWLTAAVQRLRGELAATQVRLEMIGTRGTALLSQQPQDEDATRQLECDLWTVINAYLRIGQLVMAPLLMPGAPPSAALRPAAVPPTATVTSQAASSVAPSQPAPQGPPTPPRTQPEEQIRMLPRIEPAWRTPPAARAAPQSAPSSSDEAPRALPRIEVPTPASRRDEARPLPEIGSGPPPADWAPRAQTVPAPGGPPRANAPAVGRPPPRIDVPRTHRAQAAASAERESAPPAPSSRRIDPGERWLLSSPAARHRLRAAGMEDQAERSLAAFWQRRDWTLSAQADAYLRQIAVLVASGAITGAGRGLSDPPYAPIYRVLARDVMILARQLTGGTLFAFDYIEDRLLEVGAHGGVADA